MTIGEGCDKFPLSEKYNGMRNAGTMCMGLAAAYINTAIEKERERRGNDSYETISIIF